jgi:hypothetical protein
MMKGKKTATAKTIAVKQAHAALAREKIIALSPLAADRLEHLMTFAEDDETQRKAAMDVLAIAGIEPRAAGAQGAAAGALSGVAAGLLIGMAKVLGEREPALKGDVLRDVTASIPKELLEDG